jgi:malate dehydrogenase (oxaloacetate-decarboxylating)(NADP+)
VTPDEARRVLRSRNTVIGSLMIEKDEADAMICGLYGRFDRHMQDILDVGGHEPDVSTVAALEALVLDAGTYFICDPYVNADPDVDQLVEMAQMAATHVGRFGIVPRIAFVSSSNFGSSNAASAVKMAEAVARLHREAPDLMVDGEMNALAALSEKARRRVFPNSRLEGPANLLIMPSADAANVALTFMKGLDDSVSVGPMLLGARQAAHVLTPNVTVRGIVNMTALAVVDAQDRASRQ